MKQFSPYLLGAILALFVLFLIRWGGLCPGYEYEPDCFFHARIVEEGPAVFCAKTFPKLANSTWAEHYSDKELGFHFLLWGITRIGKALGATNDYPFHYQVMFFDTLLLLAFSYLLYRHKIKHSWIYTLLFATAFPPMTYRLISLRAYLLSMTLSIIVLTFLLEETFYSWRWRNFLLVGLGFVASWCYSSPHLILCIIVPFAIADFISTKKWTSLFIMPLAYIIGIAIGLTIHPQFPNTYLMFKVQCIDVVLAFFLKMEKIPITGGNEFYLSTLKVIFIHYGTYLIMLLAPFIIILIRRKELFAPGWQQNKCLNGLVITCIITGILSLAIFRFNEYSLAPFCILLAMLLNKMSVSIKSKSFCKKDTLALLYAILCILGLFWYTAHFPSQGMANLPCIGVAEWAKQEKLPEGTVIANVSWATFPKLYFALPQYTFCWGLDPAFTWRHTPEILHLIRDIELDVPHRPEDFKKAFNAKYLYVYLLVSIMAEYFWKNGFIPIYANWDGWIFDLDAPQRVISPQTPPLPLLDVVMEGHSASFVLQMCIEGIGIMQGQPFQKQ